MKSSARWIFSAVMMSPSMRREWIEISMVMRDTSCPIVSLHAEGVD